MNFNNRMEEENGIDSKNYKDNSLQVNQNDKMVMENQNIGISFMINNNKNENLVNSVDKSFNNFPSIPKKRPTIKLPNVIDEIERDKEIDKQNKIETSNTIDKLNHFSSINKQDNSKKIDDINSLSKFNDNLKPLYINKRIGKRSKNEDFNQKAFNLDYFNKKRSNLNISNLSDDERREIYINNNFPELGFRLTNNQTNSKTLVNSQYESLISEIDYYKSLRKSDDETEMLLIKRFGYLLRNLVNARSTNYKEITNKIQYSLNPLVYNDIYDFDLFTIFKSLDLTLPSNLLIHKPENENELMFYKILFKHCIIFPNYTYDLDYNKSLDESQFNNIKFYNFYLMAFDYYGYKLVLLNKVNSFKTTYSNVSLPYGYIANEKENNSFEITLDDYIRLVKDEKINVIVNNNSYEIVNEFVGEDKDILIDPIDPKIKENVSKKIDVIILDENENDSNGNGNENENKLNNSIKLIDNPIIPLDKDNQSFNESKIKKNAGYLDDKFKGLFKQDKVNKKLMSA